MRVTEVGDPHAPDGSNWPDPARPQQMHFDVMVEDVAEAATVNQCAVSDVLGGMTAVGHGRTRIIRAGL